MLKYVMANNAWRSTAPCCDRSISRQAWNLSTGHREKPSLRARTEASISATTTMSIVVSQLRGSQQHQAGSAGPGTRGAELPPQERATASRVGSCLWSTNRPPSPTEYQRACDARQPLAWHSSSNKAGGQRVSAGYLTLSSPLTLDIIDPTTGFLSDKTAKTSPQHNQRRRHPQHSFLPTLPFRREDSWKTNSQQVPSRACPSSTWLRG